MIDKEIRELRKRLRPEKNNISKIYGCYVRDNGEIIAQFAQSPVMMPENESEKYLAILKKTISGTLGKNLIDIAFRTQQVVDSEEHRLLMALRDSGLQDEEARQRFFEKVVQNTHMEDNYLILLAHETYDVPFKGKDNLIQYDRSEETFPYFICSICPVKLTKSALRYILQEEEFHDKDAGWVVGAPELGFLFPAFDGRRSNIYNALYYCHNIKESHEDFASAIFNTELPLPAAEQKKAFEAMLATSLEEHCSCEVVQAVHDQLSDMIQVHKEAHLEDPLAVSKEQVERVLADCQVPQECLSKFAVQFEEDFGVNAQVNPKNLIDDKRIEVRTPDVIIKISPDRSDLMETRVIHGEKYILIRAEEDVEVNGVPIHIEE